MTVFLLSLLFVGWSEPSPTLVLIKPDESALCFLFQNKKGLERGSE